MHNSALINLNTLDNCREFNVKKVFYSSSACVYPEYNQMDPRIQNAQRIQYIPLNQIVNMGGKSYLVKECILLFKKTTA